MNGGVPPTKNGAIPGPKTAKNGPTRAWGTLVRVCDASRSIGRARHTAGAPQYPAMHPLTPVWAQFGPFIAVFGANVRKTAKTKKWLYLGLDSRNGDSKGIGAYFWAVLGRYQKKAISLAGRPESQFRGHFSPRQPPPLVGFHPSKQPKRTPTTPYRAALGWRWGAGQAARAPPHGLPKMARFGPQKWTNKVLPKNNPGPFEKVNVWAILDPF